MEKVTIKALKRSEKGKIACKHLRRSGQIPGIIYKGGKEGMSVSLNNRELLHVLHSDAGEHAILTLEIFDGDKKGAETTAIIHEIQTDPLSDNIVHVDLHEISLTEVIKVNVPVTLKGESAGVAEGGVLNQVLWEIEVECKAMDLPEHINVNVTDLNINDAVHVGDLEAIDGVTFLEDPEQVVVGVNPPKSEEEEEEAEGEEAAEGEPELIKKGKQEEEEGESEAVEENGE